MTSKCERMTSSVSWLSCTGPSGSNDQNLWMSLGEVA
jgi:hypothetical protein